MQNKRVLASILFVSIGYVSMTQTPMPPPPAQGAPPPPVGFPIDSGIVVLFVLALVYGIYKAYKISRKAC